MEPGELDPEHVHLPGIFVQRVVVVPESEKRIEKRTVALSAASAGHGEHEHRHGGTTGTPNRQERSRGSEQRAGRAAPPEAVRPSPPSRLAPRGQRLDPQ